MTSPSSASRSSGRARWASSALAVSQKFSMSKVASRSKWTGCPPRSETMGEMTLASGRMRITGDAASVGTKTAAIGSTKCQPSMTELNPVA